jgi:uncharacterized membrane protein
MERAMNNAHVIMIVAVIYAAVFSPWWIGLVIGLLVGLVSCVFVDVVWWLLWKLAA